MSTYTRKSKEKESGMGGFAFKRTKKRTTRKTSTPKKPSNPNKAPEDRHRNYTRGSGGGVSGPGPTGKGPGPTNGPAGRRR